MVDGSQLATDTTAPYTATVDPSTLSGGNHTVTAVARDIANNTTTSSPITLTVAGAPPDTTPPTVSITSPADGSTISGTTTVTMSAADNVGVAVVVLFLDGNVVWSGISAPYTTTINAGNLSSGGHALVAVANDAANNSTRSAAVIVTVGSAAPPPTQCAATPAGSTELSTNLSVEADQTGWTGVYNSTSQNSRVQVSGGSYDGNWAMQIGPKSGSSGAAGLNNASPYWVTNTVAGRTYTGAAMVKSAVSGLPVTIQLRETTSTGTLVSSANKSITLSDTAWHPITVTYNAQNAGDQIRYSLYGTFPSAGGSMLGDCLSLQSTP
jgi:hypothetical protein